MRVLDPVGRPPLPRPRARRTSRDGSLRVTREHNWVRKLSCGDNGLVLRLVRRGRWHLPHHCPVRGCPQSAARRDRHQPHADLGWVRAAQEVGVMSSFLFRWDCRRRCWGRQDLLVRPGRWDQWTALRALRWRQHWITDRFLGAVVMSSPPPTATVGHRSPDTGPVLGFAGLAVQLPTDPREDGPPGQLHPHRVPGLRPVMPDMATPAGDPHPRRALSRVRNRHDGYGMPVAEPARRGVP